MVCAVALLCSSAAFGKQEPRSIAADDHIKIINFNPQSIHRYTGFYGYQSSILFESGEVIERSPWGIQPGGSWCRRGIGCS